MYDIFVGLLQLAVLMLGCVSVYYLTGLLQEIREARDYVRQQNELYIARGGDNPDGNV